MIIGRMNRRILLQQPIEPDDDMGGRETIWQDVAKVWAEFRTPNVKELAATGTIVSDLIRQISIRRRIDVRRGWRILYGTHVFEIQHTFDYDMETTVLVCQEVIR